MAGVNVGTAAAAVLIEDNGLALLSNVTGAILLDDARPVLVSLLSIALLMDDEEGPPIPPETGALLDVQVL